MLGPAPENAKIYLAAISLSLLPSCSDGRFFGASERYPEDQAKPLASDIPAEPAPLEIQCTGQLEVPGRSNPYFAGSPAGASIEYLYNGKKRIDKSDRESPVQLVPDQDDCLASGSRIFFNISGSISHDEGRSATDADGKLDSIGRHLLGAYNGKSNIIAPMNSLVAVFLGPSIPDVPPPTLDFSSPESREYKLLSPELGQIFYVGDGHTNSGQAQEVEVPAGATRLFLAIMDTFEWNNNIGTLQGGFSRIISGTSGQRKND